MSKGKWPDGNGDEKRSHYEKSRWAAMGEGVGATMAAWVLGGVVVVLSGVIIADRLDNRVLEEIAKKDMLVYKIREDGAYSDAALAVAELSADTSVEQYFIAKWLDQVRWVGLDPKKMNEGYFEAQGFMCSAVQARIDKTMNPDPDDPTRLYPAKMVEQGITRSVHVRNITPRGDPTNSYRLDWTETLYQKSKIIAQANLTADVGLKYFPPKTQAEKMKNPHGMYICTFDTSLSPVS